MDKFYVRGSIISEYGRHYAAELSAGGSIPDDCCENVVDGNQVLTKTNTLKPYFEYVATGDISVSGEGDIYAIAPPSTVSNQFEKDLDDVLLMADMTLDDEKKQNLLYKMCYLNAVCAYEYFMGGFMASVVLRDKDFFEQYCSLFSKKVKPDDTYSVVKQIEKLYYTSEVDLFESYCRVFGIELPDFKAVRGCIEIL